MIRNYDDFVTELRDAGFSMGGGNDEGIYSIVPWNWREEPPYDTPVRWHTGDPETDPWEWRMRVLDHRNIAYAKLFFRKSGYITREWYPYFLSIRRREALAEAYARGTVSRFAKRIYDIVSSQEAIPSHAIKSMGEFSREDASGFQQALIELQMKMYLTVCGAERKTSQNNEEYGWSSAVFCTVEQFFGEGVMDEARKTPRDEAMAAITEQVRRLNPHATSRRITRFIEG